MDKTTFLERIAKPLGRVPGDPPSPRTAIGVPACWTDRPSTQASRTASFIEKFTGLAGEIEQYASVHELRAGLERVLNDIGSDKIGAWGKRAPWPIDVEDVLEHWHALRWEEQTDRRAFDHIHVGITGCSCAIADTGTIVIASGPQSGRTVHQIPLIHVVILRESQLVQSLGDALQRLVQAHGQGEIAASNHFISGASRSSDIENDQTIGVHGPARVMALMLTDLE
ncbi:LutC/YkgG family protein [Alicyclobacillus sacchari]|uniref:LutC/YkgG family protein n=1 Tax=Alicyclobacillus sacchari TaxID=392010 RepID=UPI001FBAC3F8|nr:LUD domain-containing protein [Alicyclobacillus sacchari]